MNTPLLDTVSTPDDLRQLSIGQLPELAQELRDFLLDSVGKTGGHFASNFGVVELTTLCVRHAARPLNLGRGTSKLSTQNLNRAQKSNAHHSPI